MHFRPIDNEEELRFNLNLVEEKQLEAIREACYKQHIKGY